MMLAGHAIAALREAKRLELAVNFPPTAAEQAHADRLDAQTIGQVASEEFARVATGIEGFSPTVEQRLDAYIKSHVPARLAGIAAVLSVDVTTIAEAQRLRCVEGRDVTKLVRKLGKYTGFERALAGRAIEQWRDVLKAKHALTASAELLLTGAAEAMRPVDADLRARLDAATA